MIGAKPLGIRFDKVDAFIRVYDGTKYLVLFRGEKNDFIYNRIRYWHRYWYGYWYWLDMDID